MKKLSVVISAFNEEKKLAACLSSVAFADEVIVVDNESSDRTVDIAKKHKAKVYSRPNNLMLNVNKNYGFTKATGDWILNLDADERLPEELQKEIIAVIEKESDVNGYNIPRKNIIFGKWIEHTGWYPDLNLRLFRRGKGKFAEKQVHEKIQIDGKASDLSHPMVHESYDSILQFVQKMYLIYAPNEAEQLVANGYIFSYKDAIRFPLREFLGRFFAHEGYRDGFHGLMLSLLMAFYHFIVFANIWENKKFVDEMTNTSSLLKGEVKRAGQESRYWFYEEKISRSKNSLERLSLKLLRKIPHV